MSVTGGEYRVGDAVLSVAQAADRIGVSIFYVRKLIRNGELAAVNIGGTAGYRIRAADLERWMLERRTTQAAAAELERARMSG